MSPSGKAPGFGPGIRGFESLHPSQEKYAEHTQPSRVNESIRIRLLLISCYRYISVVYCDTGDAYKMNGEVPYKAHEYGNGSGTEVVALVAGFNGPIKDLEQAAIDLTNTGRDAVVYTYDKRILLAGESHLLPDFIETLHKDFAGRTADYSRHRYGGVSLGGAIATGMQKKDDRPEHGLYAATGIDAAELVMKHKLFRGLIMATHCIDIRKQFEKNGHTLDDLKEQWQHIQVPPSTSFTVALGGLDYIVQQRKMVRHLKEWGKTNNTIKVIHKPWLGHNGTIKWFNTHITELLGPDQILT